MGETDYQSINRLINQSINQYTHRMRIGMHSYPRYVVMTPIVPVMSLHWKKMQSVVTGNFDHLYLTSSKCSFTRCSAVDPLYPTGKLIVDCKTHRVLRCIKKTACKMTFKGFYDLGPLPYDNICIVCT